jgi:hypothetical protein
MVTVKSNPRQQAHQHLVGKPVVTYTEPQLDEGTHAKKLAEKQGKSSPAAIYAVRKPSGEFARWI